MQLINIIQRHLQGGDVKVTDWVPSDNISRQKWQEVVEKVVAEIRLATRRPAFGLSDSEISVHYHRPLDRFVLLVRGKLGIDPSSIT